MKKDGVSIEIIESKKRYVLPPEDIVFLPTKSVSAEDLCKYFTTEMAKGLKSNGADNIKKLHVRVDEGVGQGAGCEYGL
ncbi:MAG: hypothetical protein O8C62_11290 [Candidatus Methanoperedens sp.]|nr:hypothetical protein [Candidatus Methanoperedens sp.]